MKRVLKRCVTCRKLEGLPYSSYSSLDLPSFRVSDDPPFTHTLGWTLLNPYTPDQMEIKRKKMPNVVCLFTCTSSRAVHLELLRSLTVESFLLAFWRFASRQGLPATLISDNAKTFKGSSKEVPKKIACSKEVMRYLSNRVSWKFIVEKAPWWGGFWECLIQCEEMFKKVHWKNNPELWGVADANDRSRDHCKLQAVDICGRRLRWRNVCLESLTSHPWTTHHKYAQWWILWSC